MTESVAAGVPRLGVSTMIDVRYKGMEEQLEPTGAVTRRPPCTDRYCATYLPCIMFDVRYKGMDVDHDEQLEPTSRPEASVRLYTSSDSTCLFDQPR